MNPVVRDKLCQLVTGQGPALVDDPRRCEGLLRDLCPHDKREVHVLIGALREKIPSELAPLRQGTLAAIGRLSRRLEEHLGLAEEPARWAVESWALALGVVTEPQLAAAQKKKGPPPPPKAPPVQVPARRAAANPAVPVQPVITRRPRLLSRVVVVAVLLMLVAGIGVTVLGDVSIVREFRSQWGWVEDEPVRAPVAAQPTTPAAPATKLTTPEVSAEPAIPRSPTPGSPTANSAPPLTPEEEAIVREAIEDAERMRKNAP